MDGFVVRWTVAVERRIKDAWKRDSPKSTNLRFVSGLCDV
jgi:hypothetical protein